MATRRLAEKASRTQKFIDLKYVRLVVVAIANIQIGSSHNVETGEGSPCLLLALNWCAHRKHTPK